MSEHQTIDFHYCPKCGYRMTADQETAKKKQTEYDEAFKFASRCR